MTIEDAVASSSSPLAGEAGRGVLEAHGNDGTCRRLDPSPGPSRKGRGGKPAFTLVELLVVIGIIAILISLLLPSLNKARQQAANVKSLAAIRQLTFAYLDYAHASRGTLLPGYLAEKTPFGSDPDVFDKQSGFTFVGRAARQWPWRLAGTNHALWATLRPTLTRIDLPMSTDALADADSKAYTAALYPTFGLNTVYLGGHAPNLMTDIGTAKDYYRGFTADARPNVGKHVAFKLNEVRMPAKQIVFVETIVANGSGPIDKGDPTAMNGLHYVNAPRNDTASGVYWDVVDGKARMVIAASTKRVLGLPGSRNGKQIPVSFLDGHAESRSIDKLTDMREWAPRAMASDSSY
jgi:prepilin-type N-terminal cleavage/methylation domain-containing protein